jgi:hypothetical protein
VNKRAQKLYGNTDTVAKQQWVDEEFEKRRQKRMEKERRKHIVNNVLSVPGAGDTNTSSATNTDNSLVNNQMSAYYTPLPQIDTATAAKLLDFPTDLQRQLLEQLNHSMLALTNGIQQTSQTEENTNTEAQPMDTSFPSEENTENNTNNNNNESNAAAVAQAANEALQQVIAQGLSATATTTASTASSTHNSPLPFTEDNTSEEAKEGIKEDIKTEETKDEEDKEEASGEKKPEYPMDAVLTLMQLNAGWRQ